MKHVWRACILLSALVACPAHAATISGGGSSSGGSISPQGSPLTFSGSGITNQIVVHDPAAVDPGSATFRWVYGTFPGVNGQAGLRNDSTWNFGYNVDHGGGRLVTTEPSLSLQYENAFSSFADTDATTITSITKANPAVVTYVGADAFANGESVIIKSSDMTEVNNKVFQVANVNTGANTFELRGVNSSAYVAAGTSGNLAQTWLWQEFHIQQYDSVGTQHRIISASVPWAGELDTTLSPGSNLSINMNKLTFNSYNQVQRWTFDWTTGAIDFQDNAAAPPIMRFVKPATSTYYPLQQRNAEDSAFLSLLFIDAGNVLKSERPAYFVGGFGNASAAFPTAFHTLQLTSTTNNGTALNIIAPTMTGTSYGIVATGEPTADFISAVYNNRSTTASNAVLYLRTISGSGGDPLVRWDINGVQAASMGLDNSVSGDPLVIAASSALGTSNLLSFVTSGTALGEMTLASVTQANLGSPANGTIVFCSDCAPASACTGSSTGAFAARQNGAWKCL